MSELLTVLYQANTAQAAHDEEAASVRECDMLNGLKEVSNSCTQG